MPHWGERSGAVEVVDLGGRVAAGRAVRMVAEVPGACVAPAGAVAAAPRGGAAVGRGAGVVGWTARAAADEGVAARLGADALCVGCGHWPTFHSMPSRSMVADAPKVPAVYLTVPSAATVTTGVPVDPGTA